MKLRRSSQASGYGDQDRCRHGGSEDELRPIRENYARLMEDKSYLDAEIAKGAERATAHIAEKTLKKTMRKMGLC